MKFFKALLLMATYVLFVNATDNPVQPNNQSPINTPQPDANTQSPINTPQPNDSNQSPINTPQPVANTQSPSNANQPRTTTQSPNTADPKIDQQPQPKEEIDSLSKLIKVSPNEYKLLYRRANLYLKLNDINNAILDYKIVVKLKPELDLAHFNLALAYSLNKQYDEACNAYNNAIKINNTNTKYYYNLSLASAKIKQYDASFTAVNAAIKLDDKNFLAYYQLGSLFEFFAKQYIENEQLKLQMKPIEITVPETIIKTANDGWNNAKNAYQYIIDKNPSFLNYSVYYRLAYVLLKLQQFVPGMQNVEIYITNNPKAANGYQLRSLLHRALGDLSGAMEDDTKFNQLRLEAET